MSVLVVKVKLSSKKNKPTIIEMVNPETNTRVEVHMTPSAFSLEQGMSDEVKSILGSLVEADMSMNNAQVDNTESLKHLLAALVGAEPDCKECEHKNECAAEQEPETAADKAFEEAMKTGDFSIVKSFIESLLSQKEDTNEQDKSNKTS